MGSTPGYSGGPLGFFFIPVIFLGWPQFNIDMQIWGIPAGLGVGAALLLVRFRELELTMSKEFQAMLPPMNRMDKFRDTIHPYAGAIAQEFFYRGLVLTTLIPYVGHYAVLISSVLFMGEHYFHNNSSYVFDWKDYALQLLLGISLGYVFYLSGSFIGVAGGHCLYNTPAVLQTLRRELVE